MSQLFTTYINGEDKQARRQMSDMTELKYSYFDGDMSRILLQHLFE